MHDIKAIIFDLDGTLYDYYKADDAAVAALGAYTSKHFGMDTETIRREIKRCWDVQNERIGFLCASTHSRLVRFQVVCETNGWPIFPHALNMAKIYWQGLLDAMVPEDGIRDLLTALKKTGIDLALGSNMTSHVQYLKLMRLNLQDMFDHITLSEETGLEKPESKFYEVCARKSYLRYDPDGAARAGLSTIPDISAFMRQCLFIGDTPAMDYFGPLDAGMKSCLYLPGNNLPEGVDPDCVIRSYRECIEKDGIRLGRYFIPYTA